MSDRHHHHHTSSRDDHRSGEESPSTHHHTHQHPHHHSHHHSHHHHHHHSDVGDGSDDSSSGRSTSASRSPVPSASPVSGHHSRHRSSSRSGHHHSQHRHGRDARHHRHSHGRRHHRTPTSDAFDSPYSPRSSSRGSPHSSHRHHSPHEHASDDSEHHLVVSPGDFITSRYQVIEVGGEGQFSRVVKAIDRSTGGIVALKVIRAIPRYIESAAVEVEILERVRVMEPDGCARHHVVGYHGHFKYDKHVIMVFDWCGISLYDFLTRNHDIPFSMAAIRAVAVQLDDALAFLHANRLIHTDLKTENIMFLHKEYTSEPITSDNCACPEAVVGHSSSSSSSSSRRSHSPAPATTHVPRSLEIKLIDLGNAVWNTRPHHSVIGTRHYRPPEVLLGIEWECPSDMWSVGCILVELYTGQTLFQTHHNREHLAMIERVLGPFPASMLGRASRTALARYFDDHGRVVFPEPGSSATTAYVDAMKPLHVIIPPDRHPELYDLVRRMLAYEPAERITAAQAVLHPFCLHDIPIDSSTLSPSSTATVQPPLLPYSRPPL